MRSSIALALVCVCTSFACKSDEPDPSTDEAPAIEPDPNTPPIGAWVVIDEQYGLFKTANTDAGRIASEPASEGHEWLRVAEVVAIVGDFIEVRTIASAPGGTCATTLGIEKDYELHFFVQPEALRLVLAKPKGIEFDDGTHLELSPGVLVLETGNEGRVRVGTEDLAVALADADVARWFIPTPAETLPFPSNPPQNPDIQLHYGEHSFTADTEPFVVAHDQSDIPGGRLLTFINTCGHFLLRVDADAVKDAIPMMDHQFDPDMAARRAGILGVMNQEGGHFVPSPYGKAFAMGDGDGDDLWADLMNCSPFTWRVETGTKLTWLNGGDAGVVLTAHQLPGSAEARGDRVCFETSNLDVCIAASKLEREGTGECETSDENLGLVGALPDAFSNESVSRVRLAKAEVGEGLDRDIVRRIVRAHIDEVRTCHVLALVEQPTLAGRVTIAFEITATGKVSTSTVHANTLEPANDVVATCIAKAAKRWTFLKPKSGATVRVVYPFDLSPS